MAQQQTKTDTIANLKKVVEILESNHVSLVEVAYEYRDGNLRFYTAITRNGFELHRYRVTVQDWFNPDTSQTERWMKCSCHAAANKMKCRHIIRVAQVDSDLTGTMLYLDGIAQYRAHQRYQCKQQAV